MFQSPGAVAFSIGPISIHWYGLLIALAFLLALRVCSQVAKEKGENPETFIDLASVVLLCALIGARFYYVLFNFQVYIANPIDIFKIWEGGLAIHGGIIGGLLGGYVFTRINNLSFAKYCDITAIGLILGQAIGRWGNFFNSEAFGGPTNLPWKLFIPIQNRPEQYINYEYFHPTFLYESLWDIFVFIILYFFLRKKLDKYNGAIFLSYIALYSFARFFIEGLRLDSLMMFGTFRTAQVVSLFCILSAIVALSILIKKKAIK